MKDFDEDRFEWINVTPELVEACKDTKEYMNSMGNYILRKVMYAFSQSKLSIYHYHKCDMSLIKT